VKLLANLGIVLVVALVTAFVTYDVYKAGYVAALRGRQSVLTFELGLEIGQRSAWPPVHIAAIKNNACIRGITFYSPVVVDDVEDDLVIDRCRFYAPSSNRMNMDFENKRGRITLSNSYFTPWYWDVYEWGWRPKAPTPPPEANE